MYVCKKLFSGFVTCSVHGGPCPFKGAEPFATKWDILLVEWHRLCLKKLPALLLPQGGVDCFQEVLLTVW